MRFLPAGESALLVETADLAQALALYRAARARPIEGVIDLVPAARTVLVEYRPGAVSRDRLIAALVDRARGCGASVVTSGRVVRIPVRYDGEDLLAVADYLGIGVAEVIARHTGRPWQAAFAGFAPGFVYLADGDASLQLPRRKVPRTRVPVGAVALAGGFSAIYPGASPGGWQLIGRTDVAMWDLARAEPATIQPGDRVQFIDADASGVGLPAAEGLTAVARAPGSAVDPPPGASGQIGPTIEFLRAGVQTLVQDDGRRGSAHLGISASGALDCRAMHAANQLVGNPASAPVLENALGMLALRGHGRVTLAVAGVTVPLALRAVDGRHWPLGPERAIALDDGDVLEIGAPTAGVRCYIAVRGGWQVESVLGSSSTDTLAKVGPAPIVAGTRLAVASAIAPSKLRAVQVHALVPRLLPQPGDEVVLDVALGPRSDWFTAAALETLVRQPWRVTPQSDRVGMRLEGAVPLARSREDELPSEGTVAGAIQVPAGGQPVLFLADHPLTGGYPVIAVVARHHLDLAGQIPAGCRIRFNVVAPFFEEVHE